MGRFLALILGVLLVIFIVMLGLRLRRGNSLMGSTQLPLNIDIKEILPAAWQPEGELIRLNIDGDPESEWLVFYRYDDAQLGGIVYDAQNQPRGAESIPLTDQPPAYLVPYHLLPTYRAPYAIGYLGNQKVDYKQLAVTPYTIDTQSGEPIPNRLLVRGFERGQVNRVSLFWWINETLGYGVAHARTYGWFSLSNKDPHDWQAWDQGVVPEMLWAWEPQNDRSNLCRRVWWRLVSGETPLLDTHYEPFFSDDLTFCSGKPPADPAFPEAQVLAYLTDGKRDRLLPENAETLQQLLGDYIPAYVQEITAPGILDQGDPPRVQVDVAMTRDNAPLRTTWTVQMLPPKSIHEPVHWRIAAVEFLP
ncbi:MAG: hypothetical protein D6775_11890 [Caldilineae bacterium]|nr:MAG: hypothetical protein D6775_11890 [Caldilineae bacterium]